MTENQQPGDPYLAELLRGNEEVLERARELQGIVTEEQLAMRAPAGGWSVAQVIEHIVLTGRLYTDRLDALMSRARREGKTGRRGWKPSLMGGVIMRSISPGNMRKRRTFKVFEPSPAPRPEALRELIVMHEEIANHIRAADGIDLRAVKLTSPVSPLIRLNLGDVLGILVFHAQRHLLQAGRILAGER